MMADELFKPVILSQIEDALEERQRADRRKQEIELSEAKLIEDRRKQDRRAEKVH
jgi:choline kinase